MNPVPALGGQNTRRLVQAAVLLWVCVALGCVSQNETRKPIKPPPELQPNLITIATYPLIDNDNNAYPDTIPIVVYLWDNPYPLPMWADGDMRFELRDPEQRLIAEWEVPLEVLETSRRRDQVGASHVLTLDIREATTDVLPLTNARLSAVYVGRDGAVAKTARPLGIQIGS